MGREAKAKKAKEVRATLSKEDFYELRSLLSDISLIELQAMKAANEFRARAAAANEAKDAKWAALTKALNIDPALNYRLDDRTYELIGVAGAPPTP